MKRRKKKIKPSLTITKDNYLEHLHAWPNSPKTFVTNLKKLCDISPEFTHEPRLRIVVVEDVYEVEEERLLYESHYSYGKFVALLKCAFFCLAAKKIRKYEALVFDLKSFGIKKASQNKVDKMCGAPPKWYDLERKLSDETVELIEQYFRLQNELTTLGAK